jgi:hypothetical protein
MNREEKQIGTMAWSLRTGGKLSVFERLQQMLTAASLRLSRKLSLQPAYLPITADTSAIAVCQIR